VAAEGKSRIEAMRFLKRHYHQLLLRPPAKGRRGFAIPGAAPSPMRYLTQPAGCAKVRLGEVQIARQAASI
jgi:hypothetical protein